MKLTSKATKAGPLSQLFNPAPPSFGGIGQLMRAMIAGISTPLVVVAECLDGSDALVDIEGAVSTVRISTASAIDKATALSEGAEYVTGNALGARVYALDLKGNDEESDGAFITGDGNNATLIEAITALEKGETNTNLASVAAIVLDQPGQKLYLFPAGSTDVDSTLTTKAVQESFSVGGDDFFE